MSEDKFFLPSKPLRGRVDANYLELYAPRSSPAVILSENPYKKTTTDINVRDVDFVALDCEYFPSEKENLLYEVGAIRFHLDGFISSFSSFVTSSDAQNRLDLLEELSEANGTYHKKKVKMARQLVDAPPANEVIAELESFSKNSVFVQHSSDGIDLKILAKYGLERNSKLAINTALLSQLLWSTPNHHIGLSKLALGLNILPVNKHRALADAETTALCFMKLIKAMQSKLGEVTLGQIVDSNVRKELPRGLLLNVPIEGSFNLLGLERTL